MGGGGGASDSYSKEYYELTPTTFKISESGHVLMNFLVRIIMKQSTSKNNGIEVANIVVQYFAVVYSPSVAFLNPPLLPSPPPKFPHRSLKLLSDLLSLCPTVYEHLVMTSFFLIENLKKIFAFLKRWLKAV